MKSLLLTLFVSLFGLIAQVNGQSDCWPNPSEPPAGWETSSGITLGSSSYVTSRVVQAADQVGKALNDDPCAKAKGLAAKAYCYTGEFLAGIIPCTYGVGTPQRSLCEGDGDDGDDGEGDGEGGEGEGDDGGEGEGDGDEGGGDGGSDGDEGGEVSEQQSKSLANKYFTLVPHSKIFILNGMYKSKLIYKGFDKTKRGEIIKKYKGGYSLRLGYKFKSNKKSKDKKQFYGVFTELLNAKRKVVETNLIFSTGGKTYIFNVKSSK